MTWKNTDLRTILAFAAGELPPEKAAQVAAAAESDDQIALVIQRYRSLAEIVRSDDSVDPPAHVVQRAMGLFKRGRSASWIDRATAAIATIVFDSRVQPAGVRYAGLGNQIHLAFEHGDCQFDLVADRNSGGEHEPSLWTIRAQAECDDFESIGRVAILKSGGAEVIAEPNFDERMMIRVELPSGAYDICLEFDKRVIVFSHVELP